MPGARGRQQATLSTDLADAAPQVAVAGGHNVALVLPHALADAVVRVGAAVAAGQALNARVLQAAAAAHQQRGAASDAAPLRGVAAAAAATSCGAAGSLTQAAPAALMCLIAAGGAYLGDLERHAVLLAQLFQLSEHAISDAGRAFGVQAVQHAFDQVDLRGGRQGGMTAAEDRGEMAGPALAMRVRGGGGGAGRGAAAAQGCCGCASAARPRSCMAAGRLPCS